MIKTLIACLIIFSLISCSNSASEKNVEENNSDTSRTIQSGTVLQQVYEDSLPKDIWIDSLLKIDFVQKSNHYIDSFSNQKHGIAFLADSTNKKEILYNAGYNGPDRFETYYQFYVYPQTKQIMVYDPVADKKLTIDQYAKKLAQ